MSSKGLASNDNKSMQIKLAILGDRATQFLAKKIIEVGPIYNIDFNIFENDYDQINHAVIDKNSDFYSFQSDVTLALYSSEALQEKYYLTPLEMRSGFVETILNEVLNLIQSIKANRNNAKIIISNFPEIQDGVFGNNANKHQIAFLQIIRRINIELMEISSKESNVYILDIALLQSIHGRNVFFDSRLYVAASMTFTADALDIIARNIAQLIVVSLGNARKCLILDLDNTLWGGIIGDDGIEKIELGELGIGKAFTRLQLWAKELRLRGILLAVCSKNSDDVAKVPFVSHPDMVLRLDDISIFVANWEDKATNIRYIQSVLNIGFDSMVFIDDNPFERELVRSALPEITVPDLPNDPSEFVDFLTNLNLFESGVLSNLDHQRTEMIQKEIERKTFQNQFSDESDFLKSIQMKAVFSEFDQFNTPRVSQLSERSNQYNLRTIRYSEDEVTRIKNDAAYVGITVSLSDNLGDHGLISVVTLKQSEKNLFIENWFMSCRVLKRGVELLILNKIIEHAKFRKCEKVIGEFIPTKKNALVKDHFLNLGFTFQNNLWEMPVEKFIFKEHFIEEISK